MKLSVLIPVYNEKNTVLHLIEQIKAIKELDMEIIMVDDLSSDGTRQLLMEKFGQGSGNIRIFYHDKNMGKGSAIQTALAQATGDYCIIQDADLEYDPNDYKKLMAYAEKNNSGVVYGSRFYNQRKTRPSFHFFVNKFLTALTNILYGSGLTDMETCYKLIKTDIFKSLNLESRRFEVEPEITAKLLRKGYNIAEIPIFYKGRTYHEGKKITWKDGIVTVWVLFKLRCTS